MSQLKEAFEKSNRGFKFATSDGIMVFKLINKENVFVSSEYVYEHGELVSCEEYESNVLPVRRINDVDHTQVWSNDHSANVWIPLRDI